MEEIEHVWQSRDRVIMLPVCCSMDYVSSGSCPHIGRRIPDHSLYDDDDDDDEGDGAAIKVSMSIERIAINLRARFS